MVDNNVRIRVGVDDNATPKINSIKSGFMGLGGVGKAALAGVGAGIGVLTAAAGGVALSVAGAQDALIGRIGSTATAAQFMGKSFDEVAPFVQSVQKEMVDLAATLPGTTADYVAISDSLYDSVIPAFQDLNGVFDEQAGTDALKDLAGGFGVLQAQAGLTTRQTSAALDKILSGTASEAQLLTTEFGMKNRAFMDSLSKVADERNQTMDQFLQDSDPRTLLEGLTDAINATVTDDLKANLSATASGAIEGIKTKLFDPIGGLFGALREVTVGGEATDLASEAALLINAVDSFAGSVVGLMESLGINIDPMQVAAQSVRWLTTTISSIGDGVDEFAQSIRDGDFQFELPTDLSFKLGSALANGFNFIAQGFSRLASLANNQIQQIDFTQVASNLGRQVGEFILGFANNINFAQLLMGAGDLSGSVVGGVVALNVAIVQGVSAFLASLAGTLTSEIVSGGQAILGQVSQGATQLVERIKTGSYNLLVQTGEWAGQAITNLVGVVTSAVAAGASSIGASIGAAISGLFSRISTAVSSAISSISIPIPGLGRIGGGGPAVANRASGQGVGDFMSAVAHEQRQAPGTTPVVANSSETIIPQSDLKSIVGGLVSGANNQQQTPVNKTVNVGGITIISQAGQDVNQLAEVVMQRFRQEIGGQLA